MTKITINISYIVLLAISAFCIQQFHSATFGYLLTAAILPLTLYFLLLLANLKNLTKIQIDNTYYFGFLITITSLAVSAFHFKIGSGMDITLITKQFSIGLVATGLALAYKLVLLDIWEDPADIDLLQKQIVEIERFTRQARNMFGELMSASEAMSKVAHTSLETVTSSQGKFNEFTRDIHERSLRCISERIQEILEENFRNLKSSSDDASRSVLEFSSSIDAVNKGTDFKKISSSILKMGESCSRFSEVCIGSLPGIELSTNAIESHKATLGNLSHATNQAAQSLLAFRKKVDEDRSLEELNKSVSRIAEINFNIGTK